MSAYGTKRIELSPIAAKDHGQWISTGGSHRGSLYKTSFANYVPYEWSQNGLLTILLTRAQAEAWPAVKAGRQAPTSSEKTLAAFLAVIDDLVRQGLDPSRRDAGNLRLAHFLSGKPLCG